MYLINAFYDEFCDWHDFGVFRIFRVFAPDEKSLCFRVFVPDFVLDEKTLIGCKII